MNDDAVKAVRADSRYNLFAVESHMPPRVTVEKLIAFVRHSESACDIDAN